MRALSIAATGMAAQDLNVQVIANNIANINTTAFKRARAEFTDLIYQAERLQGVSSRGQNNTIPEGAQLGLGVRTAAIRNLHIQGALANTGKPARSCVDGARLVSGHRLRRRNSLHKGGRIQHECERPDRDHRWLCCQSRDDGSYQRGECHRQPVRSSLGARLLSSCLNFDLSKPFEGAPALPLRVCLDMRANCAL